MPPDLPGLLSLSVLATACAQRYQIRVRQGWIEPVNLYLLVALPSGTRKSVVFEAATQPLVAFELEQARRIRDALPAAEEMTRQARLRLVVAADSFPQGSNEHASTSNQPEPWRVFISDATPERVASLLAENAGRLAVLSDEGEICSIIAGRYGGSFEVFLKSHNGQVLTIERQGRARVHVRKPALTLGLAVQPDVLRSLMSKRHVRERGLLARFLVAVPPSNVGYRAIAPSPVPDRVIESYGERMRELLEVPDHVDEHGDIRTTMLTLSSKAHDLFTRFEAEVEEMLRPDRRLGTIISWGSKLPGAIARIAALLWKSQHPEDETEIDATTIRRAITIGDYFIPHALAAFDRDDTGGNLGAARTVMTWLQNTGKRDFTRRELHQALRRQFPRNADLDPPLSLLLTYGWLRERTQTSKPGRPSVKYKVNPALASSEF